jgi:hypothetical protein
MSAHATLSWGIKNSLVTYIEKLEDGAVELAGAVTRTGDEFVFTADEAGSDFDIEAGLGILQFEGTVTFTGHWGGMRIAIENPRLIITPAGAELATRVTSVFGPDAFHPFAQVDLVRSDLELVGMLTLLPQGQQLMGPQYQVGQEFSPLTVSLGAR